MKSGIQLNRDLYETVYIGGNRFIQLGDGLTHKVYAKLHETRQQSGGSTPLTTIPSRRGQRPRTRTA